MSCYMLDSATFDVIAFKATLAYQCGGAGIRDVEFSWLTAAQRAELEDARHHGDSIEDTIGRVLAMANARSLRARYGDTSGDDAARLYAYTPRLRQFTPVAVLKILNCYDYQACEFDGYRESLARELVDRVRHAMIAKLPGYEDAPWGVRDDEAGESKPRERAPESAPMRPQFRLQLVRP